MDDDALAARLSTLLAEPQHHESLVTQGYAVIDSALADDHARALLDEMRALERDGDFAPNCVQFSIPGRAQPIVATKPGVYEIDLHDETKREKAPCFDALFGGDAFARALQPIEVSLAAGRVSRPSGETEQASSVVRVQPGVNGKTIKLQINKGGAFPVHYDNPGRPNRRRWTCLVYLNPDWADGDGGEVVLLPFGDAPSGVTVAPLFNRLLIFRSDLVLHRVLTAKKQRFCFTIWVDAHNDDVNADHDVFLKQKHLRLPISDLVELMRASPLQRVISRAVYADAYEDSLMMCINGRDNSAPHATDVEANDRAESPLSEGSRYMIAAHRAQVRALERNGALAPLIEKLRALVMDREREKRKQAEASCAHADADQEHPSVEGAAPTSRSSGQGGGSTAMQTEPVK
eukprot:INCI16965.1.p1 GENE.INCI16965.1~~INCI16965.1.p1  ORF type:complete len:404 (-),score=66.59 INCI16965.1:190-1401(-)